MIFSGVRELFSDFSRVWQIMPHKLRKMAVWIFCSIFFQMFVEVATILSISFMALSISSPEYIFNMQIGKAILLVFPGLAALQDDPRYLILIAAAGVTVCIIIKNVVFAYILWFSARFSNQLGLYLGGVLLHHFLHDSYVAHIAGDNARKMLLIEWTEKVSIMINSLMEVYTYFAITLGLSAMVIVFTPVAVLLVMLILGFAAACIYRYLRRHTIRAGQKNALFKQEENRALLNAMYGIREIIIYGQQKIFFNKWKKNSKCRLNTEAFLLIAPTVPTWVLETAGFIIITLVVFVMIMATNSSIARITATISVIMLSAWRILPILNRALSKLIIIQGVRPAAMECLVRVEKILKEPSAERIKPAPNFKIKDSIELKNVFFSYPKDTDNISATDNDKADNCLKNVSLVIPKGARIGIIGRSGAGKSTISLLLSGLAKPDKGDFLVDGRKISSSEMAAYRAVIGFVPQSPYVMGGSIAENVAFSQWGLPYDKNKVINACKMAAFDVAEDRGIETMLGQNGAGLSGGQAQRLSIARALYAEPSVLIFDEATSALDTGTEKSIISTIYSLPKSITTVTIAHRLDTIAGCDLIYWIEKGEIMAFGTPEEILPKYRAFLEDMHIQSNTD